MKNINKNKTIVGVVSDGNFFNSKNIKIDIDLNKLLAVELRLDLIANGMNIAHNYNNLSSFIRSNKESIQKIKDFTKIILTIRHESEGGKFDNTESERKNILEQIILDGVIEPNYLDIEIKKSSNLNKIVNLAKSKKIQVIGSYHDFNNTPNLFELSKLHSKALENNADIIKFAVSINSVVDMINLMEFIKDKKTAENLSIVTMGKYGKSARILMADMISKLNYSFLGDSEAAPGQWSTKEMYQIISSL